MTQTKPGMFAALMTALSDQGEFSEDRQRDLTTYVLGQGLDGLYVGGSSGESGVLDCASLLAQQAVVRDVAQATNPYLIAHVGMPSLAESVALAKNAGRLGYNALSALPPHAYPYSDDEILAYYRALSQATSLPMIVYEIPIRTGRPLPQPLLEDILDLPNVAGIKFTSTDLYKFSCLRRSRPEKTYYFGFDEIFSAAAALGADGGIGTTYNLFGRLFAQLWHAVQAGDQAQVYALQTISQEFVEILCVTGVLPGMKLAFRHATDINCGPVRAPLALRCSEDEAIALLEPFLSRSDVRPLIATT